MLDLHIRTITRRDLEDVKVERWTRPDLVSLALNGAIVVFVMVWLREPLAPEVYHSLVVAAALAVLFSHSPHQEARVAALKQIKDALVQFVQIENKMYHRARKYRNQLAQQVNELQSEIDAQKGWFYSWTSFWRQERMRRDTSTLEGLAIRTTNAVGTALSASLADHVIKTRGFGPIIFVCLPRQAKTASDFFATNDHVVYGVYFFGCLLTRFHAATTLLRVFPQTLESDRLIAMRQDALRLRSLVHRKEHELHQQIKVKYGLSLDA